MGSLYYAFISIIKFSYKAMPKLRIYLGSLFIKTHKTNTSFQVFTAWSVHIAVLWIFTPSNVVTGKYFASVFKFERVRSSHISRMQGQYHDGVHFTQKSLQLSSPVPTYWPHIASLASVERCALENTCISSENRVHITWITSNCTKWRSQQWQTQHWHWTLRQVRVQVLAHKEGYSLSCTPTRTQFLPRRS